MSECFLTDRVELHCGDCLAVLAMLPENSIDSCVTDPPYHLTSGNVSVDWSEFPETSGRGGPKGPTNKSGRGHTGFMGKVWDGGDIAFRPETWAAVYRVLKPGAHLVAMGGTRTYHRLACAIEDAGFEIRDCLSWNFGSGFPKSHSCAKGILDLSLSELRQDAFHLMDKAGGSLDCCSDRCRLCDARLLSAQVNGQSGGQSRHDAQGHIHRHGTSNGGRADSESKYTAFSSVVFDHLSMPDYRDRKATSAWQLLRGLSSCLCLPCFEQSISAAFLDAESLADIDWSKTDAECVVVAVAKSETALRSLRMWSESYDQYIDGLAEYEGFGTALKPAMELIVLARKPLSEGTVAANVLRWGTGAINVDGCRIHADDAEEGRLRHGGGQNYTPVPDSDPTCRTFGRLRPDVTPPSPAGRWPANVVHDGSDEVLAAFPDAGGQQGAVNGNEPSSKTNNVYGQFDGRPATTPRGDSGSAARFFFQAKPNQIEQVVITWISESEPCQATLLVDMGQLLERATVVSASVGGNGWSTFLSGSTLTDLFRAASTCTIRTATDSTTESRIWNCLISSLTSASIADVNYETVNGGSPAANVVDGVQSLIITLGRTVSLPGVSLVASGTRLKISVSAATEKQIHSAKRFWYGSKADADDRLGARHPTIKPLDLMQWLVRLVTPRGGKILDCFAGTGTTGEAAFREGFSAVLIERDETYCADIRRRMKLVLAGPDERQRESIKAKNLPRNDGPLFAPMPDEYNGHDDFAKSYTECLREIRERKANGGEGWEPK